MRRLMRRPLLVDLSLKQHALAVSRPRWVLELATSARHAVDNLDPTGRTIACIADAIRCDELRRALFTVSFRQRLPGTGRQVDFADLRGPAQPVALVGNARPAAGRATSA